MRFVHPDYLQLIYGTVEYTGTTLDVLSNKTTENTYARAQLPCICELIYARSLRMRLHCAHRAVLPSSLTLTLQYRPINMRQTAGDGLKCEQMGKQSERNHDPYHLIRGAS